jgi:hypothetical protein
MFCNMRELLVDTEDADRGSGGHLDRGHIAGLADPAANLDYVASHLAERAVSPLENTLHPFEQTAREGIVRLTKTADTPTSGVEEWTDAADTDA